MSVTDTFFLFSTQDKNLFMAWSIRGYTNSLLVGVEFLSVDSSSTFHGFQTLVIRGCYFALTKLGLCYGIASLSEIAFSDLPSDKPCCGFGTIRSWVSSFCYNKIHAILKLQLVVWVQKGVAFPFIFEWNILSICSSFAMYKTLYMLEIAFVKASF